MIRSSRFYVRPLAGLLAICSVLFFACYAQPSSAQPLVATSPGTAFLAGDINENGELDTNDLALLRLAYLGGDADQLTAYQRALADVNENGRVDSNDYIRIRSDMLGICRNSIEKDIAMCTSMIDLANNSVQTTGNSSVEQITSSVWETQYTCRAMREKGSSISFVLSDLQASKALTLEVEELHLRDDSVFAYTVTVNGKEVYFRTYAPSSDGLNHYYIPVDGSLIGDDGQANVTFTNYGDTAVRFGRVWGYSDMETLLSEEGVERKLSVSLLSPQLTYRLDEDIATVQGLLSSFGESDMYEISFALELSYMSMPLDDLYARIDYIMQLSAQTKTAFHLGLNSWWSGTPEGPDGQGGYFSDIQYHQVVYDPLNVDGRGNWKLTTPNIWSNTAWLTMNSEAYNHARNYRLRAVTSSVQQKLAEYRADGGNMPNIGFYMENEPVYWPYYVFNGSPEASGDFSVAVIEAAKADGITLDPTDGLSHEEKVWMYQNLRSYISAEGEAVALGFAYDTVVINNGLVTLPDSQQIENTYTHMIAENTYPMYGENYRAWETHAISALRTGSEWAVDLNDERILDYMSSTGKFANVNAERSSMSDYMLLPQAYLYGADHVTIYNFNTSDTSFYQSASQYSQTEKEVTNYNTEVMSYTFGSEESFTVGTTLVQATNIQRYPLTENYIACPTSNTSNGGTLVFKVDNNGQPFTNGLVVEINGRILSDLAPEANIVVYAGATRSGVRRVATLSTLNPNQIDVSNYIDKTKSVAYIRLQLCATNAACLDWVAVSSVKAYTKWDKESGSTDGLQYTYEELRNRNLFTAYRIDTERLLSTYLERAGRDDIYQNAVSLYRERKFASAYRLLISYISQTLPATYLIVGQGTLGDYGMAVDTQSTTDRVFVTLTQASYARYAFTLSSPQSTTAYITLSGLRDGDHYLLSQRENGSFILTLSDGTVGSMQVQNGQLCFALSVHDTLSTVLPSSLEVRAYQNGTSDSVTVQIQDASVSHYDIYRSLALADGCVVLLGRDGDSDSAMTVASPTDIRAGDYLRLQLNEQGEVTQIKAYRGQISGTVTEIRQMSIVGTAQNAAVTVRDAYGDLHTFEIGGDCKLAFDGRTGDYLKMTAVGNIGLQVGQTVTVDYCPMEYNGNLPRAFLVS